MIRDRLKKIPRIAYFATVITAITIAALLGLYLHDKNSNAVEILTDNLEGRQVAGRITSGKDASPAHPGVISTTAALTYESDRIKTPRSSTNAAYISWNQSRPLDDGVHIEVKVFDGSNWSKWIDATTDAGERPDNAELPKRGGFIAGKNIQQLQYRLKLEGNDAQPSPEVDVATINIQTIDASKGPSLERVTAWRSLAKLIGLDGTATARKEGPRIHSRLAWGSPEPYDSPRWDTSYEPLKRAVVHHTATVPGSDSLATIRAIWEYHANTLGWGDIGYNYLVDQNGNIFQGRYFDATYAEQNNVDVVGGHTYENNRGTTGIAALGDFTNTDPTNSLLHYVGEVAAYKMGPYGLNPASGETYGGNLLAHRDLLSTSCPGQRLYDKLQTIRGVASALFPTYYIAPYAWQYVNQYAYLDSARQTPIDPNAIILTPGQRLYLTVHAKNTGSKAWYPDGDYPVRLGTSRPYDRLSSLCDEADWLSCGRVANIAEPQVLPGQIGSVNYSVVIPENPTNDAYIFKEYFNFVAEGKTWFNDPGLYWTFPIAKPYAWQYVNQRSYLDADHTIPINLNTTPLNPGQKAYLVLDAKNVGSTTWLATGANPVRLGTSNSRDRLSSLCGNGDWISCSRASAVSQPTPSGSIGEFEFVITAPSNSTGGVVTYKEYLNILSEGKVWLNDPGLYWVVKVNSQ